MDCRVLCLIAGIGMLVAEFACAETLANPAAVLCKADGATVVIETAPNGNEHGVCVFPSGERINEWAYFRNKHRTKKRADPDGIAQFQVFEVS